MRNEMKSSQMKKQQQQIIQEDVDMENSDNFQSFLVIHDLNEKEEQIPQNNDIQRGLSLSFYKNIIYNSKPDKEQEIYTKQKTQSLQIQNLRSINLNPEYQQQNNLQKFQSPTRKYIIQSQQLQPVKSVQLKSQKNLFNDKIMDNKLFTPLNNIKIANLSPYLKELNIQKPKKFIYNKKYLNLKNEGSQSKNSITEAYLNNRIISNFQNNLDTPKQISERLDDEVQHKKNQYLTERIPQLRQLSNDLQQNTQYYFINNKLTPKNNLKFSNSLYDNGKFSVLFKDTVSTKGIISKLAAISKVQVTTNKKLSQTMFTKKQ